MPRPIFKPAPAEHIDPKALAWRHSRRGMDALAQAVGIQRRASDVAKSAIDRAKIKTVLLRSKPRVVLGTPEARALGIGL